LLLSWWFPEVFEALGWFELVKPVKANRLHHAAVNDDHASLIVRVGIEAFMRTIRRDINKIARLPLKILRRSISLPDELIRTLEFDIVVQIIA
jgi:hypothetical protein